MIGQAPQGWDEVYKLYGDPRHFTKDDGTVSSLWEARMSVVTFPHPLPLGWNKDILAKGARVHNVLVDEFAHVFELLEKEGLWQHLRTYDGGYAYRQQRSSTSTLSLHAFGAAIDLNAETNQLGTPGDMHLGIVQVFEACGFTWGGRWKRPDPMHAQYAGKV